jgi:hypothetical protein
MAVALLLAGCTAPVETAVPGATPEEHAPMVAPKPAVEASPAVTPTPEAATVAAIDPARLVGYVSSREASREMPPTFAARVTAVDGPSGDGMGVWRFVLADTRAAASYEIKVQAPATLPAPLQAGDGVQVRVRGTGGGPNYRLALVFTADDGGLLLAVNEAPVDWKITRGQAGAVDRGSDYVERRYGVVFEHAGVRVAVAEGAWARMVVGPVTYYVWGSAAQRRLRPGKRPMPDYVGAWQDFAVVRAR